MQGINSTFHANLKIATKSDIKDITGYKNAVFDRGNGIYDISIKNISNMTVNGCLQVRLSVEASQKKNGFKIKEK